jgi:hypothetical protein
LISLSAAAARTSHRDCPRAGLCGDLRKAPRKPGSGTLGDNGTTGVSLFFAVLPGIFSERGVVFGRNPGPRLIRRVKKQQKTRCSAAVFRCFREKEQRKSRKSH